MIRQHPDLASLPELKLFAHRTIAELQASLPRYCRERGFTHRSPGLVRALALVAFGEQEPDNLERARVSLDDRSHWSGAHVLDTLLARLDPRVVVEKSPESVATGAALRRLARAYPNARYLHLTRHPVTTQVSIVEHRRRTVPSHPVDGQPMAGIAAWLDVHERIMRFLGRLPPERVLRVQAETCSMSQYHNSRRRPIGLAAHHAARSRPCCTPRPRPSRDWVPEICGVMRGQDPGFLRDPIPHAVDLPQTIEQPLGWRDDWRLWQRTVALARRFGYGREKLRAKALHRRDLGQPLHLALIPTSIRPSPSSWLSTTVAIA